MFEANASIRLIRKFAQIAHAGQRRKYTGENYVTHPAGGCGSGSATAVRCESTSMFKYRISHKIRTVAELAEPTSIAGFRVELFAEGPDSDEAWLATEEASASDVRSAVNSSRTRLLEIIDALAAVLQCSFTLIGASFMAYRMDDNPDCIIFFRHLRPSKTVGMMLWKSEQITDVERLRQIGTPGALRYFREAMNAATSSACLAMLVTTAEALAGQSEVTRKCEKCGHEYSYSGTNRAALSNT